MTQAAKLRSVMFMDASVNMSQLKTTLLREYRVLEFELYRDRRQDVAQKMEGN